MIKPAAWLLAALLAASWPLRAVRAQLKLPAALELPALASGGLEAASLLGQLQMPHILEPTAGPPLDDERLYLRPGIGAAELLRARGYVAHEFSFLTRDGYQLPMIRATNPLAPARSPKLPLLFINAATISSAGYLVNSAHVRPRMHKHLDLSRPMSVKEAKALLGGDGDDEPAIRSLPFLALNLGYECWFMSRRGFSGPRRKRGHEKRTLWDAWLSVPQALLGELLRGSFAKEAQLDPKRPMRTQTHSRDPATANQNQTLLIKAGRPEMDTQELSESERVKVLAKAPQQLRPPPPAGQRDLLHDAAPLTILNLMIMLAKLPGALKRMGDIRQEFIETFDPDFWRFSLDEQVEFDVPRAIDFVLEKTGKRKLHAVGLSCGGAVALLALAREPQLARKISRAIMWAPSVTLGSKSDIVRRLGQLIPLLKNYVGPIPFVFLVRELQHWMQRACAFELLQRTLCASVFDTIGGFSGGQAPFRPFMAAAFMTPTGVNELIHLGQMAHTQRPCKFSFPSKAENLRVYGSEKPPCYDLGRIALKNISFYVGAYDTLVSPDDIATTELQMRVPSELHIIKGEQLYFNHFGFLIHDNNDELAIIPSMLDIERSDAAERRAYNSAYSQAAELDDWEEENQVDLS